MAIVTVIIPTFNRKALLLEALASVFRQTLRDLEVVVVDDGSTDDTQAALAPYASKIKYIYQPNAGGASARNAGIIQAHTPYLAFLDSDDLWEPTFLETTTNFLEHHHDLGLISTGCVMMPKGKTRPRMREAFLKGDLFGRLFQQNFFTLSAVVAKRECFEKVGTFNESLEPADDYDMWLRIATTYPIAFLNQPLCQWREHSGNITNNRLWLRQSALRVVEANFDPTRISRWTFRNRRSQLLVSLGRVHLQLGQVLEAKKCFQQATQLTHYKIRPWKYLGIASFREKFGKIFPFRRKLEVE